MKEMTGLSNLKTEFKKDTKGSSIVEVLVAFTILLMCIGVLFSASRMTFNLLQKAKENNEITRAKNDILYMLKPVLVSGTITDQEAQKSFALSPGQYNTLYRDNYDTLENPAKAASGSTEKKEMVFALKDGADTIALTNTKELKYTITIDGNEYTVYAIDCDNISMPIKDDPFETNPGGEAGSGEGTGEGDVPGEEYVIISDDYLEIVKELFTIEKNDDGTYNYPEKGGIYYYDGDFYGIVEGTNFESWTLSRNPSELANSYLITPLILERINPPRVSEVIRSNEAGTTQWGSISGKTITNGDVVHSHMLNGYYVYTGSENRTYNWYTGFHSELNNNSLYSYLGNTKPDWANNVYEVPEPIIAARGEIIIYDLNGTDEYYYYANGGSGYFYTLSELEAQLDHENTPNPGNKSFKRLTKSIPASGSGIGAGGNSGGGGSGGGESGGIVIEES